MTRWMIAWRTPDRARSGHVMPIGWREGDGQSRPGGAYLGGACGAGDGDRTRIASLEDVETSTLLEASRGRRARHRVGRDDAVHRVVQDRLALDLSVHDADQAWRHHVAWIMPRDSPSRAGTRRAGSTTSRQARCACCGW